MYNILFTYDLIPNIYEGFTKKVEARVSTIVVVGYL